MLVEYGYMGDNPGMREPLQMVRAETNAEYALVFIQPMLSGETQTN